MIIWLVIPSHFILLYKYEYENAIVISALKIVLFGFCFFYVVQQVSGVVIFFENNDYNLCFSL